MFPGIKQRHENKHWLDSPELIQNEIPRKI